MRILAAWLILLLGLPNPLFALHPEEPLETGLEEQLRLALNPRVVGLEETKLAWEKAWDLAARLNGIYKSDQSAHDIGMAIKNEKMDLHSFLSALVFDKKENQGLLIVGKQRAGKSTVAALLHNQYPERYELLADDSLICLVTKEGILVAGRWGGDRKMVLSRLIPNRDIQEQNRFVPVGRVVWLKQSSGQSSSDNNADLAETIFPYGGPSSEIVGAISTLVPKAFSVPSDASLHWYETNVLPAITVGLEEGEPELLRQTDPAKADLLVEELMALRTRVFPEDHPLRKPDYERILQGNLRMAIQTRRAEPRGVMVVRSSGKIVGYVYASPSPMEPRIINIDELGVDPEAQRNKYGTKLFQAMVQHIETYRDQVDQIKVTDASEGQRTGNIASSSGFKTSSIMGAFRVYTRNIALSQRYAEVARIVFRALNINPSDSGLTVVNIAQPDLRVRLTDRSAQTIQIPEDQIKVIAPSGESQPSAQFPRAVFYASGVGLDPELLQDTWKLVGQEGWLIFMADLAKGRRDLRLIPEILQRVLGAESPLTAKEILDPEDGSLVAIAVSKTPFTPAVVLEEPKLKPKDVHVLIAEDEPAIRDLLERVVRQMAEVVGIDPSHVHVVDRVEMSEGQPGALDQIDQFKPDFVSTDMNMKDLNRRTGIQVAEKARRVNPSARVHLVAYLDADSSQIQEKDDALASGVLNGFIAKPRILAAVSSAFDQFLKDRVASGLEESERMSVSDFMARYGASLKLSADEQVRLDLWSHRNDVQANVMDLPNQIPLYIQGDGVFWKVIDNLLPRTPRQIAFMPVLLPISSWKKLGLILQDPLFPEPKHPDGLKIHLVSPEQVPALDPMTLIMEIFRSRLEIPGSEGLGAMVFTDAQGQARLVWFSA